MKIRQGTVTSDGACGYCNRGKLSDTGRSLDYPYTYVFTFEGKNGGLAPRFCKDCLVELELLINETLVDNHHRL